MLHFSLDVGTEAKNALEDQKMSHQQQILFLSNWSIYSRAPLMSKCVHSDLEVLSWIIPAPPCRLLPAWPLSVWVCLCMSLSLLNSEECRYSEWRSNGATQTCTSLHKHRRWRGFQQAAGSISHVENREVAAWKKKKKDNQLVKTRVEIKMYVTAWLRTSSKKSCAWCNLLSFHWFPVLMKLVACFHGYSQRDWKDGQE